MELTRKILDQYHINNRKDLAEFFLYTYEYSYLCKEIYPYIRKLAETSKLSLPFFWIQLHYEYAKFQLQGYPYRTLVKSIDKSIQELSRVPIIVDIQKRQGNELLLIDMILDDNGIPTLLERPAVLLQLPDESSFVFTIYKKWEKQMREIIEKRQKYFSKRKFNEGRNLTEDDLNVYQDRVMNYLEIWMLYLIAIYEDMEIEVKSINDDIREELQENHQMFLSEYFRKMPEKEEKSFKQDLMEVSEKLLEEFLKEEPKD